MILLLENVSKTLSKKVILDSFDLSVAQGEFIVVIGPSGSGKSTLLRLVSGLEEPSTGQIWMQGKEMNGVSPAKRDIAMVFQDFALYPHMTVFDNMAYALKMRKQPRSQIKIRVEDVAASLGLNELLYRKPASLSGGQKQRVAMGRALVRQPSLFLFDEPLSNLDLTLKSQVRFEIKRLHQMHHITSLYVTHDQVEAMILATRILVLNHGKIEQFDTPTVLYNEPASLFVGTFMSLYAMNVFPGVIDKKGGFVEILDFIRLPLPELAQAISQEEKVFVGIRAEDMRLALEDEGEMRLAVKETMVENMGADLLIHLVTEHGVPLIVRTTHQQKKDSKMTGVLFSQIKAHLFLASSGKRIGGWNDTEAKKI